MTTLASRAARTKTVDSRRRLVVIGNGMAGARAVEEILARGGGVQYRITMSGDEDTGNIFLNSLAWYQENDITLHSGVRVERIDRFARLVFSDDGRATPYDVLVIATGSRSHLPPMDGMYTPGGRLLPGIFA